MTSPSLRLLLGGVLLLGTDLLFGCLHDTRETRDRGASGVWETVPEVPAPAQDRCQTYRPKSPHKLDCLQALELARNYVRNLSATDAVCMEGGFGDPPRGGCLARAEVSDVATGKVLIEIRNARPESRWYQKVSHQLWFAEEALVDLYLSDRGY